MDSSPALFLCPQNLGVAFIQTFQYSLNESFENRRLAKVASPGVWEIRKITEFPAVLLFKSCLLPVETSKEMNECQITFSSNIYLLKVNNRKTKGRFEIVQS